MFQAYFDALKNKRDTINALAIEKQNRIAQDHIPDIDEQKAFLSSMNSYLGIMKHYKTYKLRKEMIFKHLSGWWFNFVYLSGGISKFVLKQKPTKILKRSEK